MEKMERLIPRFLSPGRRMPAESLPAVPGTGLRNAVAGVKGE